MNANLHSMHQGRAPETNPHLPSYECALIRILIRKVGLHLAFAPGFGLSGDGHFGPSVDKTGFGSGGPPSLLSTI